MRIAIVTLPFHTNYGGILQAYALRRVLMGMGHEAVVLALRHGMPLPVWWKAPAVYVRRAFLRLFRGDAAPEVFRELRYRMELPVVSSRVGRFVDERISPEIINSYSDIPEGQYDAFVVGSDQVWRPRYFGRIEDAFLGFTKGWDVLRVSYAASFGTSELEYSPAQLASCSGLLDKFDAVSVREEDAVGICWDWFGCGNAVHVLDPVMLLGRDVYSEIASCMPCSGAEGKLVSYLLDNDFQKEHVVRFVANAGGMEVHDCSVRPYDRRIPVSERVVPPLEQWLACLRDAAFVVTDSFHACVLCILFHKPFIAVGNRARGMARLKSLMEMCALEQRLVHGIDSGDDCRFFLDGPCWDDVDRRVLALRRVSLDFLCGALEK